LVAALLTVLARLRVVVGGCHLALLASAARQANPTAGMVESMYNRI
jgi:hypothetical protein